MPLFRRSRPLKRWHYVGVFGEQCMICAEAAQEFSRHRPAQRAVTDIQRVSKLNRHAHMSKH
jgi:hypothetical protein